MAPLIVVTGLLITAVGLAINPKKKEAPPSNPPATPPATPPESPPSA